MFEGFNLVRGIGLFNSKVDELTEKWLDSTDEDEVFEFYTNADALLTKHYHLASKQEVCCFWDMYMMHNPEGIAGEEVFHVVINTELSVKDPIRKFKLMVDAMTEEYIKMNGDVTCELSTSADNLHFKHLYLQSVMKQKGVVWVINLCDVCEKNNKNTPYHVEIIDTLKK